MARWRFTLTARFAMTVSVTLGALLAAHVLLRLMAELTGANPFALAEAS